MSSTGSEPLRVAVVGSGLVACRAARLLVDRGADVTIVARSMVDDDAVVERTTWLTPDAPRPDVDVAVLATTSMHQVASCPAWLDRSVAVVATADRPEAIRSLWALGEARSWQVPLAIGAAHAPGLTTVMVHHLTKGLDRVDRITTARFGTGGPACAREHHRSMATQAWEIRHGRGRWMHGGSGRTLVWFPEPIGPQDCYRAGLAETVLLHRTFPGVDRIQALQAATRRDRLTAHLPMLRRPHAEGLVGGGWAEVRGRTVEGSFEHRVMAASAPQATGAAAVAAAVAGLIGSNPREFTGPNAGRWPTRSRDVLALLPDDVRLWTYDGAQVERPGASAPVQAARKWRLGQN